jgi:MFS family permease
MLCCSSFFFFASFNMLIPELPAWLTELGGAEYKGLIISLFTITAMISRPFSGKLADTIGRVPVIMVGSAVCFVCSLLYPVLTTVAAFLFLRLLHGFSTGFTPTGQAAYLADIIPANRRGEAMGFLGTAGTIGMAAGPALGGLLGHAVGIEWVFYCSSLFAVVSLVIVSNIKETLQQKKSFHLSILRIRKGDVFEPAVIVPCVVMVLSAYAYGAMFTLIPDMGEEVGVANKGLLFTYLLVASFLVRLAGGKASDLYGRRRVLYFSTLMIAGAMALMSVADTKLMAIIAVIIYGAGQGVTSPTLLAWATDLSPDNMKGRGIASLYICMELGIGAGALFSGFIYSNEAENFAIAFGVCSVLAFLSFLYLITGRK